MTLLDSHPWLHQLLILLSACGFFGGALIDALLQASYSAEIGKTATVSEVEQKLSAMQGSRAVLGFVFLASGLSLFSLIIHSPVGK